ncbi:MAG TPA: hypothetical protein VL523_01505 [Terriglobia bacterium]|nr:hypothetical protein [Terriglobia bacterium]
MKTRSSLAIPAAAFLLTAAVGRAQEKKPPAAIPLRVTVLLNEYDGNKKLTSLPYVMPCKATDHRDRTSLRLGFQVPYKAKQDQIQYQNVGTDIDCNASLPDEEGRYIVDLNIAYTAVFPAAARLSSGEPHPGAATAAPVGPAITGDAPITGGFQANLSVPVHDGQTVEAATATDPVSGHVWKVEVTLNVVK